MLCGSRRREKLAEHVYTRLGGGGGVGEGELMPAVVVQADIAALISLSLSCVSAC